MQSWRYRNIFYYFYCPCTLSTNFNWTFIKILKWNRKAWLSFMLNVISLKALINAEDFDSLHPAEHHMLLSLETSLIHYGNFNAWNQPEELHVFNIELSTSKYFVKDLFRKRKWKSKPINVEIKEIVEVNCNCPSKTSKKKAEAAWGVDWASLASFSEMQSRH